jgi:uncharacterized Zn-binding protein involved in type VI secretion
MARAARVSDPHSCPASEKMKPHVGGPIVSPGVPSVKIGGKTAAVVGTKCVCKGATDAIARGSSTVFIGNRAAARKGDPTAHKGVITGGCSTVDIGG